MPAGKVVHRERFALNRHTLELFATKVLRPTDHVAFEATTNCWAVADALRPHVAKLVVSNPLATKAIAQAKVKTDKVDAHVLAQLLRCDFLPEVWQPDEATRRLRELTGRRSALVGQRTMMRNRIHSVLAMRLIEVSLQEALRRRGPGVARRPWRSIAQGRMLIDSDLRQLEFLQKQIAALDLELARRGYASDAVKLLMTLPGFDVAVGGRRCWPPGATTRASPTAIMPPATWAWRLPPSNRRSTATTAPSPSAATATRGGC